MFKENTRPVYFQSHKRHKFYHLQISHFEIQQWLYNLEISHITCCDIITINIKEHKVHIHIQKSVSLYIVILTT